MKNLMVAGALVVGVMFGYAGRASTQTEEKLPIAGQPAAKDIAAILEEALPQPALPDQTNPPMHRRSHTG